MKYIKFNTDYLTYGKGLMAKVNEHVADALEVKGVIDIVTKKEYDEYFKALKDKKREEIEALKDAESEEEAECEDCQ